MELSWDFPIHLPQFQDLLKDPQGNPHHLLLSGGLQLMAWWVTGNAGGCQAFQMMLPNYSQNLARAQTRDTTPLGLDGELVSSTTG